MTEILKYNLSYILALSCSNFEYSIPTHTLTTINNLCSHVNSPSIISATYKKKIIDNNDASSNSASSSGLKQMKKRKGNKSMEVSAEEWESIRTFQATKIEQKTGIDGEINHLQLLLNKLTDKTFLDIREKVIHKIGSICADATDNEDLVKVGNIIYEILSSNKFYSKIYCDLFSELFVTHGWLQKIFYEKQSDIMSLYINIEYVDPQVDYDQFCNMNKNNERRKAKTTFYVNLALNGIITCETLAIILQSLLSMVCEFILKPDKKNEVDELSENIAILYNKDVLSRIDINEAKYFINTESITETITRLAKCKAKDYSSLSNKAIFKFMDLVEI